MSVNKYLIEKFLGKEVKVNFSNGRSKIGVLIKEQNNYILVTKEKDMVIRLNGIFSIKEVS